VYGGQNRITTRTLKYPAVDLLDVTGSGVRSQPPPYAEDLGKSAPPLDTRPNRAPQGLV